MREIVIGNILRMRATDLLALGIVLIALGICGALVSLWSRRSPRAEPAQVIPRVQPAAPDPVHPKPAPQSQTRKAA